MSSLTPRLSLKNNDGTDAFLLSDFVGNNNILDASPGIFICTSSTLPTWGSNQAGRMVFLTDWKQLRYWDGAAWNDERTAAPIFGAGTTLTAVIGKNTTISYTVYSFTTPRPCTIMTFISGVFSLSSQLSQDVRLRVNFDGTDQVMGGYSDKLDFAQNSFDNNNPNTQGLTAFSINACSAGSHTIKGTVLTGSLNASVTLVGLRAYSLVALYSATNVL